MDIHSLTTFFMWCTIINGSLLIFWAVFIMFAPDFIFRIQSRWFPVPRETYDIVIYLFFGGFKILFLIFNAVPYAALLIVGG